jgi:hypothetical protein
MGKKIFSLFNVGRWDGDNPAPECCGVVPILYSGAFSQDTIDDIMWKLQEDGSSAAPGYMKPEGIIIYLPKVRQLFKRTFEYEQGKWSKK